VPDCGFNEPLHVGIATPRPSPARIGRCRSRSSRRGAPTRAATSAPEPSGCSVSATASWGFQNGIAFDAATKQSRSAISVLRSDDGIGWRYRPRRADRRADVRLARALRLRLRRPPATRGRWYLYFNGRDQAPMLKGREAIGFVVAHEESLTGP
jgi:hypothetical protein